MKTNFTAMLLICLIIPSQFIAQTTYSLGDNAVTVGEYSLFLGYNTGIDLFNETDSYSTVLGAEIGSFSEEVYGKGYNTIIGAKSGMHMSIQGNKYDFNEMFGSYVGYRMTFIGGRGYNVLIGSGTAQNTTIADENVFLGTLAGGADNYYGNYTRGSSNTLLGFSAGFISDIGDMNLFIGSKSGQGSKGYNGTMDKSVFIGNRAGYNSQSSNDICLGSSAGELNTGQNNLFIGNNAGFGGNYSNKLIIHNDIGSGSPLLEGDFSQGFFTVNGKLGVNKVTPEVALDVDGEISATKISAVEVKVKALGADFVFKDDYQLRDLESVEGFIEVNNHLPDIPSAKEMENNGIGLAKMNQLLLQKIEELTLYTIEQEKRIKALEEQHSGETISK